MVLNLLAPNAILRPIKLLLHDGWPAHPALDNRRVGALKFLEGALKSCLIKPLAFLGPSLATHILVLAAPVPDASVVREETGHVEFVAELTEEIEELVADCLFLIGERSVQIEAEVLEIEGNGSSCLAC